MDTWSIVQLATDSLFAVLIAGAIAGFLYRREKRLKRQVVAALSRLTAVKSEAEASATESTAVASKGADTRIGRAEKYLEAVRMYRSGRNRKEIENRLGISLMELELLGKAK
jgi:Tfp pilus assembly major pilin PilA